MNAGLIAFLLIVAFIAGGLLAFRRDANRPLPKNLPPPLKDEDDETKN
jgi:hypothetical protein